ncbi:MAG: NAD-dependent epimerase/dehydratase family protein [bacterium]
MSRKTRTLVLGATGHLGQAVVRDLLARGQRVTAASRQLEPRALADLGARIVRGDADADGQLDDWMSGHDVVIDAAAPSPLSLFVRSGSEPEDLLAHARRRTTALLDAVARHGVQLAFISTFTTLPRPAGFVAQMESRWRRSVYPYFRVKQLMEDMVLGAARNGVPAVVLNPAAFLGPWQHGAERSSLVRMVLERTLPAAMHHVINVIDVRDVASGVHAALAAQRYGVQLPLVGHNVAMDDLVRRIGDIANVRAQVIGVDTRATVVAAFWLEATLAMTGRAAPDAWRAAPLIADAWPMQESAEQRALGVRIRPLDETLRDAIAWHLDHPHS